MKSKRICRSTGLKIIIAIMGLIVFLQFFVTIGINITDSIPQKVFLIIKGISPSKGDFVAFRFQGSRYYKKGKTFIKILVGKECDRVETIGRQVILNKLLIAIAKDKDLEGNRIEPFKYKGVIPPGKMLVLGISKDSYDSRYFGFIDKEQIIGRAIALF